MSCSGEERMEIPINEESSNVTKLIPFPEPGIWYLGLQVGNVLYVQEVLSILYSNCSLNMDNNSWAHSVY